MFGKETTEEKRARIEREIDEIDRELSSQETPMQPATPIEPQVQPQPDKTEPKKEEPVESQQQPKIITTETIKVQKIPKLLYVFLSFFFLSSIALSIKALWLKEEILLYLSIVLIMSMLFIGGLLFLIILNKEVIFTNLKLMLGRGIGYGKVKILQNNGHFNIYIRRFTEDGFRIYGDQYRFDKKRVYADADGDKCIFYRQGDVEPIDIMSVEIPMIDGKLYAQDIDKAMSAGALSVQKEKVDYTIYISVLSLIASGLCLLILFKLSGDISEILEMLISMS